MQTKDETAEPALDFSHEFNQEAFSKVIPYNFKVDWTSPVKGYSQELQAEFYEYNIQWLDNFNPDVLEQNRKHLNIYTTYKIIAVPGENKVDFYNIRLVEKNTHKTPGLSLTALGKYSGRVYYFNEDKEKAAIGTYIEGQFRGTLVERTEEEQKQFLQTARMEPDCYTETTYHYTDYYNGATGDYLYSVLNDITYTTVCDSSGGGYDGGSGGTGGGSYGGGGDGSYDDCGDAVHGCFYEIEDVLVPEEEVWEATQIDDTQLAPCMQPILNDLTTLTKGVAQIVTTFSGSTPGYNWEVKDGPVTGTGETDSPANYNYTTGTITSTFDSKAWPKATNLSWARTVLHESVHAYLASYFAVDRPNWIATYPQMVQEWGQLQNWNDVHHEEFARSIVNNIALSLQEYGNKKGLNYSLQFYQDLAWGGLQNTSTFQSLPASDQKRILDTIAIEATGRDTNGNIVPQKGQGAGC